jgi:uncharacterized protein (DUF305 family)
MKTITLSLLVATTVVGAADAQQSATGHAGHAMQPGSMQHGAMSPEMAAMHGGPQAGPEYMAVMDRMQRDMTAQSMDPDPTRAWALMMIPHHQGAVDSSRVVLKYTRDPEARRIAEKTIEMNEKDRAELQDWLARHGGAQASQGHAGHAGAAAPSSMSSMAAMHGGPQAGPEYMAGMERMQRDMMARSMDPDPTRAWALMMIPHHQGAIDSSRTVLKYTQDAEARRIAQKTIDENQKDQAELQALLDRRTTGGRTPRG